MKLKKMAIAFMAVVALVSAMVIPSKPAHAYIACRICGERLYPGQKHVCPGPFGSSIDRGPCDMCYECGKCIVPGKPHRCVFD